MTTYIRNRPITYPYNFNYDKKVTCFSCGVPFIEKYLITKKANVALDGWQEITFVCPVCGNEITTYSYVC